MRASACNTWIQGDEWTDSAEDRSPTQEDHIDEYFQPFELIDGVCNGLPPVLIYTDKPAVARQSRPPARRGPPAICETCNMTLADKGGLKRHVNSKHNTLSIYRCPFCGHCSREGYTSIRHSRTKHGSELLFRRDSPSGAVVIAGMKRLIFDADILTNPRKAQLASGKVMANRLQEFVNSKKLRLNKN